MTVNLKTVRVPQALGDTSIKNDLIADTTKGKTWRAERASHKAPYVNDICIIKYRKLLSAANERRRKTVA